MSLSILEGPLLEVLLHVFWYQLVCSQNKIGIGNGQEICVPQIKTADSPPVYRTVCKCDQAFTGSRQNHR